MAPTWAGPGLLNVIAGMNIEKDFLAEKYSSYDGFSRFCELFWANFEGKKLALLWSVIPFIIFITLSDIDMAQPTMTFSTVKQKDNNMSTFDVFTFH